MGLVFFQHPVCEKHELGAGHPESPERLRAIRKQLEVTGLVKKIRFEEAPLAERAALTRVHHANYVDAIFGYAPKYGRVELDPDTSLNPYSLDAALRAAGANIAAVDQVLGSGLLDSDAVRAFCGVRPPGHHAEHARAMGFCIFNNVAVAAAHALEVHGLERVAIVDFDVHHGNGTEEIFADSPQVLLCSSFQHPFYPGTGANSRAKNVVNIPLRAGTDGAAFRRAVETPWRKALDEFAPQLLLVSAGFDAHAEDPLAGLCLQDADFQWISEFIVEIAERHAKGRIVSTLEGGYSLAALARSVVAHLRTLDNL